MGKSVHAPGPARDYFNTWVNKRIPGFNIDSLPSMSIMGSEIAQFGFGKDEASSIAESPYEEGRDVTANSRGGGGGLENAAASIETWLRGAWAKKPGTPKSASNRSRSQPEASDLIELADTNSDDGWTGGPTRISGSGSGSGSGLLDQSLRGSTARSDGPGTTRGRSLGPVGPKGKKGD